MFWTKFRPLQRAFMSSQKPHLHPPAYGTTQTQLKPKVRRKSVRDLNNFTNEVSQIELFRAQAYSTAESYNFAKLENVLKLHYEVLPSLADDVFRVKLSSSEESDTFIFPNGTFCVWGSSPGHIHSLMEILSPCASKNYESPESEYFDYYMDESQSGGMNGDTIVIGSDLSPDEAKLVYSAGMSRSVKLASLENRLNAHLDRTSQIPEIMSQGGKLPISRSMMLKNLGELFSLRSHVNLQSEMLDLPDFCWSCAKMEQSFVAISRNLDVRPRISIFNKKLDYASEMAEVLRNHLHEKHSIKLEWYIIWLIAIEIGFEFAALVERMFF